MVPILYYCILYSIKVLHEITTTHITVYNTQQIFIEKCFVTEIYWINTYLHDFAPIHSTLREKNRCKHNIHSTHLPYMAGIRVIIHNDAQTIIALRWSKSPKNSKLFAYQMDFHIHCWGQASKYPTHKLDNDIAFTEGTTDSNNAMKYFSWQHI